MIFMENLSKKSLPPLEIFFLGVNLWGGKNIIFYREFVKFFYHPFGRFFYVNLSEIF